MKTFLDGRVTLHGGDCLSVVKEMADNSIDSVCTDPPYFLTSIVKRFGSENAAPAQYGTDGAFSRLSGGFMSRVWDDPGAATGITVWEAWLAGFIAGEGCFRVQSHKEGKYYACSFQIRLRQDDLPILEACREKIGGRICLREEVTNNHGVRSSPSAQWIVETKEACTSLAAILDKVPLFAKKAADYALWRRALYLWMTTPKGSKHTGPRDVTEMKFLHEELQKVKRWDHGIDLSFDPFMRPDQFFHYRWTTEVMRILKPGGFVAAFSSTRTYHRLACAAEDAGFIINPMLAWVFGQGFPKAHRVDVEGYEGWRYGLQALKPAFEPILFCQKPFSEKTGSENVARWGTGAINVDGCRVGTEGGTKGCTAADSNGIFGDGLNGAFGKPVPGLGRFPANLCHDGSDEVLDLFPETGKSTGGRIGNAGGGNVPNLPTGVFEKGDPGFGDSGSAARFFYSAKASKADRALSKHPTVKPVKLMQWLCRLITPPGGVTLDPFAGTGTTGEAAWREGFSAVLIEREEEYQADIERRMLFARAKEKPPKTLVRDADGLETLPLPLESAVASQATMAAE